MLEPKILEKLIVWLVLIGFVAFCFGYIYTIIFTLGGYKAPIEIWFLIIPLAFLLLAALGLKIFRSVFIAKE